MNSFSVSFLNSLPLVASHPRTESLHVHQNFEILIVDNLENEKQTLRWRSQCPHTGWSRRHEVSPKVKNNKVDEPCKGFDFVYDACCLYLIWLEHGPVLLYVELPGGGQCPGHVPPPGVPGGRHPERCHLTPGAVCQAHHQGARGDPGPDCVVPDPRADQEFRFTDF